MAPRLVVPPTGFSLIRPLFTMVSQTTAKPFTMKDIKLAYLFIYYKIVHWVQHKHINGKIEANTEKYKR